jgi:hypothetical protein
MRFLRQKCLGKCMDTAEQPFDAEARRTRSESGYKFIQKQLRVLGASALNAFSLQAKA